MRHHLTRILFGTLGVCAIAVGGTAVASDTPPVTLPAPVTPPAATLQIHKSVDRTTAHPGDTVRYTVTVTNNGSTPIAGAKLSDNLSGVLDDATYNNDATADRGSVSFASPELSWTGDLAPGTKATVGYSVKVHHADPSAKQHGDQQQHGNKQLGNKVTSTTAGSNCPSDTTDPACSTSTSVS
ncbi:hypothetical protein [Streptomyces sp. NPDC053048]|uniref:DUF7927 domain-containing protein n=1 Tax=Streptomyces sp. NPDC053048 TaxID=3365694 RepID=UPI0037D0DA57